MTEHDPYRNSKWSENHKRPKGNKVVAWVAVFTILFCLLAGIFLLWPSSDHALNKENRSDQNIITQIQNDFTEMTAKAVPDIKYSSDDAVNNVTTLSATYGTLEPFENELEIEDSYQNSFHDALNTDIKDVTGEPVGELHDIIVDKQTGQTYAIIIDDNNSYFNQDLSALSFSNIISQTSTGDLKIAITENKLDKRREFNYSQINTDDFISLRHIKNSRVIDDKGKYVGEIDALIYQNAKIQGIYFIVKPSLTQSNQERLFKMPYETIALVKNEDGYDIQLSTKQTKALASELYSN